MLLLPTDQLYAGTIGHFDIGEKDIHRGAFQNGNGPLFPVGLHHFCDPQGFPIHPLLKSHQGKFFIINKQNGNSFHTHTLFPHSCKINGKRTSVTAPWSLYKVMDAFSP